MKITFLAALMAFCSMSIAQTNRAPVANNDYIQVGLNTPATLNVLSNDYDLDSTSILTLNALPVAAPRSGTVTLTSNGTCTYVPNASFVGTDSFQYRICDNANACATAWCIIRVSNSVACNLNAYVATSNGGAVRIANPIGGTAPFRYEWINVGYSWNNGATTALISVVPNSHACVTITDSRGCIAMSCDSNACNMRVILMATYSLPNYIVRGSITGGTAPYSYLWSNGVTTATTTGSIYTPTSLTVRDSRGCVATAFDSLYTVPSCSNPSFSYYATQGTNTINFYNTSGIGGTSTWNFGDGNSSSARHPRHTYRTAGTYNVTLVRTTTINGVACTRTITQQLTVGASVIPCQASFAIVRDSAGYGRLINTSTGAATNASWSWTFSNGSSTCVTHNTPSTSVTFNCPGRYVLCLTTFNPNSSVTCSSTFCDTINVDANGNVWKSGVLYRLSLVSPYYYTGALSNENVTGATGSAIIYPNPANDLVTIKGIESAYTARIYNNVGMLVQTVDSKDLSDNTLSLQAFSRGLYFLQIETASGEKQMHKLMINK